MKIKKIDILKYIFFIIILFPFIQQRTFEELPNIIQMYYKYGTLFASSIIYLIMLLSKKFPINKFIIAFLVYWIINIISTLVFNNHNDIYFLLQNAYNLIAIVLFISKETKDNPKQIIRSLSIIYHFFIIANFLLFLIFPQGIYQPKLVPYHTGHLLGDDNALIYVILPGIIITCFDSILSKGKLTILNLFEIVSCAFLLLKLWTVTAMVCFLLFIVLLVLDKKSKMISTKVLYLIFISFIVLLFFGLNLDLVQNVIINIFHKSATLSGRTLIWQQSFEFIKNKLLIGYGGYFKYGAFLLNGKIYPCHTTYLQIIIDSGIIGLSVFGYILVILYKKIKKYEKNANIRLLAIGFTCILINYLFEYSQIFHLVIIMAIIYNIEYILKYKEEGVKNEK